MKAVLSLVAADELQDQDLTLPVFETQAFPPGCRTEMTWRQISKCLKQQQPEVKGEC